MSSRAYAGVISPDATRDMEAVGDRLRNFGPVALATFSDAARTQLTGAWTEELNSRAGFNAQQRAIVTAAPIVVVGAASGGVSLAAATGGTGALGFLTRPMEFGADREAYRPARYPRGSQPGTYQRRTRRQLPPLSARGWIAYPSAGVWSTRVFKMAMQVVVKVAHDAIDGGRR